MYSFLVLGLIPGTNLQITFQDWLNIILLTIAGSGIALLYLRRHQLLDDLYIVHRPVPAWQLHQRLMSSAR